MIQLSLVILLQKVAVLVQIMITTLLEQQEVLVVGVDIQPVPIQDMQQHSLLSRVILELMVSVMQEVKHITKGVMTVDRGVVVAQAVRLLILVPQMVLQITVVRVVDMVV